MMYWIKGTIALFLFFIYQPGLLMPVDFEDVDLYKQGFTEKEAGNYEKAAELWIEYAGKTRKPDYKVSHELIKLVTQHRLTDHYEKASELYFWGLQSDEIDAGTADLLVDELFYMDTMLGQREHRRLERLINQADTGIFAFLHDFWDERNLTPSDNYNERLMEHWERVNFALENYNTSSRMPFDDRGKIYIRFGEPDKKRSGVFMFNPGFANYVIATRMDDGRGQGSGLNNAINTTTYLNTLYQVREYHQYPSFEVWVYTSLTSEPDNVVYIFGNTQGGSVMTEKQSVDDFIPSAAYSMSERNNPVSMGLSGGSGSGDASGARNRGDETDAELEGGSGGIGQSERIIPALVLQFMYYRQLASLDVFFSDRYDEMMDSYMNTSMRLSTSAARRYQQVNSARLLISQAAAPAERSSNLNHVFNISTQVHPYRFFDDELNPYLKVYFIENTEEAITFEELKKRNAPGDIRYDDYEVVRTVQFGGENGERFEPVLARSLADQSSIDPLERNMVHLPYHSEAKIISAHSELYDISMGRNNGVAESSTLRENLKGIGFASTDLKEIETSTQLFISDVIIGYRDEDLDIDSGFVISHDRILPGNHSINFYYEAYNIPRNDEGLYSYSLTYRITRERSLLGRIIRFGKTTQTSMTINNTHDAPRFSQMLEIVSDELDEGDYTLELLFSVEEESDILHREQISFTVE